MKESFQSLSQDTVSRLKKKGQERLTIMIIPHGQDKVFSLQLNWYLIIFFTIILGLLISLSIYGAYEGHIRRKELNRLNYLYGTNFNSALKLGEQSEKLKESNEILYSLLSKISMKLGVEENIFSILPSTNDSENKAIRSLTNASAELNSDFQKFVYLPPVFELKTIQYQIDDKSPLLQSLKYFFVNGFNIYQKIPMGRPFKYNQLMRDSSGYGARSDPFNQLRFEFHPGYDTRGPLGTVIHSTAEGKVHRIMHSRFSGYGRAILIKHPFGYYSLYAHLSRIHVKPGDDIKKNQLIGELGSTGRSTGPHIHYEIRYNQEYTIIDSLSYMCAMDYITPKCKLYHSKSGTATPGLF